MLTERAVAYINAAKTKLETEYQRTEIEPHEFRTFRQKINDLEATQPRPEGGTTLVQSRPSQLRTSSPFYVYAGV